MIVLNPTENFAELSAYFPEPECLAGSGYGVEAFMAQKKQEQSRLAAIKPGFGHFPHHCPTYIAKFFFVSFVSSRKSLTKLLLQWYLYSPSYAFAMVVNDTPHREG